MGAAVGWLINTNMASEASEASLRRKDSSGCSRRREEEGRKWVNGKGIEGAIAMAKRRRA